MTMANNLANALLQTKALPSMRGHAQSLLMLAMRGGMALGALLTGITTTVFGAREGLRINGLPAVAFQFSTACQR